MTVNKMSFRYSDQYNMIHTRSVKTDTFSHKQTIFETLRFTLFAKVNRRYFCDFLFIFIHLIFIHFNLLLFCFIYFVLFYFTFTTF